MKTVGERNPVSTDLLFRTLAASYLSSSLYFLRKKMLGVCLLHLSQLTNFNYILQETLRLYQPSLSLG